MPSKKIEDILEDWEPVHHKSLSKCDLKLIKETASKFLQDEICFGLEFQVWDLCLPEWYGICIGMFLNSQIILSVSSLDPLLCLITSICDRYLSNPYHYVGHAIDVTYMTYYMLLPMSVSEHLSLSREEKVGLLIAALGHDVDHPGVNNGFQVQAKTPLAQKYNNQSVLENNSLDIVLELLEENPLLPSLFPATSYPKSQSSIKKVKDIIKHCILQTDMTYHFRVIHDLVEFVDSKIGHRRSASDPAFNSNLILEEGTHAKATPHGSPPASVKASPKMSRSRFESLKDRIASLSLSRELSGSFTSTESIIERVDVAEGPQRLLLISCLLHAADISNPARPFDVSQQWSDRVVSEFFSQGEREAQLGFQVSPNMDRNKTNETKLSMGFTDIIVKPFYELLTLIFPKFQIFVDLLTDNIRRYEEVLQNEDSLDKTNKSDEEEQDTVPDLRVSAPRKPSKLRPREKSKRKVSMAAGCIELPEDDLMDNVALIRNRVMCATSNKPRKKLVSIDVSATGTQFAPHPRRMYGSEVLSREGSLDALLRRPRTRTPDY